MYRLARLFWWVIATGLLGTALGWVEVSTNGWRGLIDSAILREIASSVLQANATLAGLFLAALAISTQGSARAAAWLDTLVLATGAALAGVFLSLILIVRAEGGGLDVKVGFALCIGATLVMLLLAVFTLFSWWKQFRRTVAVVQT